MNTTNLRDNYPKFLSHLENADYQKEYVRRFKREIETILHLADAGKVSSYADVYQERLYTSVLAPDSIRIRKNMIWAIERFDLLGHYPNGTHKRAMLLKSPRNRLCIEYKAIIDCYVETESERNHKKPSSIQTQSNNGSMFLLALQEQGITRLADVTEDDVFKVFSNQEGNTKWHYSCKHNIGAVLKTCVDKHPDCARVLAFLPAFKRWRKNIQYLTQDEVVKVRKVLLPDSKLLSLRDKAIGTLALYMGLRGCDISNITMDSVDWKNDMLHINQQKTGVAFSLPLSAIVGNAIHDYITLERPETECNYIFIAQTRPFGKLKGGPTMSRISSAIMKAAGIRQESGDRQGFHIFRHNLATTLLGNGVSRPVISNIVGHIQPKSLESYMRADFPHLKECAVGIERFPVSQEVFEI